MSKVPVNDPSDSDSDLPDLSLLFPTPSNEINDGDIVWAKHKKLYWPALVRRVYKKEKKITIWYTDDPGKTFKVPMSKVAFFHDSEKKNQFRKDAVAAGVVIAHDGLSAHAKLYLNRKAEGYVDDPKKFFDQTYPYLTVEEFLEKNPTADKEMFSDMKISPLYIDHTTSSAKNIPFKKRGAAVMEKSDDDSDIELVKEEVDEEPVKQPSALQEILLNLDLQENECVNKIISCIKSGKVDKHLSNVFFKNIPSVYHDMYLRSLKSNARELDCISYGPVQDMEKIREIIFYLLDLYEKVSSKTGKKRMKVEISHSTDQKINAQFVASVWLPESIICAISQINNISLSEASKEYLKDSGFLTKKIENVSEITSTTEISLKDERSKDNEDVISDKDLAGSSFQAHRVVLSDVLEEIGKVKVSEDLKLDSELRLASSSKESPKKKRKRQKKSKQ